MHEENLQGKNNMSKDMSGNNSQIQIEDEKKNEFKDKKRKIVPDKTAKEKY